MMALSHSVGAEKHCPLERAQSLCHSTLHHSLCLVILRKPTANQIPAWHTQCTWYLRISYLLVVYSIYCNVPFIIRGLILTTRFDPSNTLPCSLHLLMQSLVSSCWSPVLFHSSWLQKQETVSYTYNA